MFQFKTKLSANKEIKRCGLFNFFIIIWVN